MDNKQEKIIIFNRESWVINEDKEIRYKNMRDNLKQMNVLKAFEDKNNGQ